MSSNSTYEVKLKIEYSLNLYLINKMITENIVYNPEMKGMESYLGNLIQPKIREVNNIDNTYIRFVSDK